MIVRGEGERGEPRSRRVGYLPDNHDMMRSRASRRLAAGGTDLALLSADEQREELSREYGAEITKYFKRIRKNSDAPLRYILVQEQHKSGLPHFHALIHERDAARPIRLRAVLLPSQSLNWV